jgi:hypothetical protein
VAELPIFSPLFPRRNRTNACAVEPGQTRLLARGSRWVLSERATSERVLASPGFAAYRTRLAPGFRCDPGAGA